VLAPRRGSSYTKAAPLNLDAGKTVVCPMLCTPFSTYPRRRLGLVRSDVLP
jgi:hypothetical protein